MNILYYNIGMFIVWMRIITIGNIIVDAVQVDGFKIETRLRQQNAIIDQPVVGGGTDLGPYPWNTYLYHWPVVL